MIRIKPLTPELPGRALMSEELLMLAVLEQALADLGHHCAAVRADAEAYFFNYAADSSVFSFDAVCGQFGLSASAIRRKLRSQGAETRRPSPAADSRAA
jgi:hypothetical protein